MLCDSCVLWCALTSLCSFPIYILNDFSHLFLALSLALFISYFYIGGLYQDKYMYALIWTSLLVLKKFSSFLLDLIIVHLFEVMSP